jgi:superfamily II DNA or RNA helicase
MYKPYYKKPTSSIQSRKFIITEEYKQLICSNSYIGAKGYTIPKEVLQYDDENIIKKELTVKPESKNPMYSDIDAVEFSVFRENQKKVYIPRFYGIERYGSPVNKLSKGDVITCKFNGTLRDYQIDIVDTYINHVMNEEEAGNGGILLVYTGAGKTLMGINIISKLKKKTIIIVHKSFLTEQWTERLNEFLPEARIGIIQGPIFDIENKDVVIAMIQTLISREFPPDAFSSFGLTIIDETHHACSQEFSKSLSKVITPYMLGITATLDRLDGLTKVLHYFLGPTVYKLNRKNDNIVNVYSIKYISNNDKYNETEYDFRGMVKYSTMVSKISNFEPRKDFCVIILEDLIKSFPENQVMVLANTIEFLKYLYHAIVIKGFATCGYYIGGKKDTELKDTETKQIVLASYSMASEALDIKTLDTLFMVSPKTNIIQSVGRILRERNDRKMIIDLVDNHDTFINQWNKRRIYYRRENYKILQIDSNKYNGFEQTEEWKEIFTPKKGSLKNTEQDEYKCLIKF